jgi:hypothetical protein
VRLSISDGERELDLLEGLGIYLADGGFQMPVVARELAYAESADSEGRRRVRSRSQNAEGQLTVFIRGEDEGDFWDKVDDLLELVESCHRKKGTVTYEPPRDGEAITWDVEAMTATELPQRGVTLRQLHAEVQINFEVLPYGKLTQTQLLTGEPLNGPIDYLTVEDVPGQVAAPVSLQLVDASSQGRYFIEMGIQNDFDPDKPEPVFLTAGPMDDSDGELVEGTGTGGTSSRPTGAYTRSSSNSYTIRATLSTTSAVIAKTDPLPHRGLWKIRARVQASAENVQVRLAWRSGLGVFTKERWVVIATKDQWLDLDLGTVSIPIGSPGTPFEAQIEAASASGTPTFDIDTVSLIPADRYARFRGQPTPEVRVLNSGRNMTITDRESLAETEIASWTARSAAEQNFWSSVTYGNGTFVAVSEGGTNRVMTSPDGITWTARSAAEQNTWQSITYGDNLFVAVSSGGTNRVMTSPDGITWTARSAAEQNTWQSITYGDNLFVAVSSFGINQVMTSPDGITWTARSAAEPNLWTSVTYGDNLFVAVSGTGTNRVMTSPDGITWTARSAAQQNIWTSVTYGDNLFVAVSGTGTNRVMTSPDPVPETFNQRVPVVEGTYPVLPPATRNGNKSRIVVRARRNDIQAGSADTGLTDNLGANLTVSPRIQLGPATGS